MNGDAKGICELDAMALENGWRPIACEAVGVGILMSDYDELVV